MPSQEDYLDNLLKGLDGAEQIEEPAMEESMDFSAAEIQEVLEEYAPIGVEDTVTMTEDDIERLLAESEESAREMESLADGAKTDSEESTADLLDMLSESNDEEMLELHDLLEKSDNDEAINDDIVALLQDDPIEETDLLEEIMNAPDEISELLTDEKEEIAKERKRLKDEKRAERLAAKEAKMAMRETNRMLRMEEKAAKDAEKKARKEALQEERRLTKEAKKSQKSAVADVMQEEMSDSVIVEKPDLEPDFFAAENTGDSTDFGMPIFDESIFESQVQNADVLEDMHAIQKDDLSDIEALLNMAGEDVEAVKTSHDEAKTASVEEIVKEEKPRKKKAISRLMDFLTEAADDDETSDNNENIQLSEENKAILEEMDKDKKKKKKDKKSKKGKKDEENTSGNDEDSEENDEEKKPKKAKKEKKPKKEKIPKEMLEQIDGTAKPDKKLSLKKVMPIVLACLTIGVVIIVVSQLAGDYAAKRVGREAYYEGDYQTCYQNLYGKDLNESEQVMYGKSESILRIRLWIREYELLTEEGAEAEALDSLIQSVKNYPTLDAYATQWNADSEVNILYAQILGTLESKYHLTEAQALEIASQRSDVDYSMMIYAIIDGEEFGSWEETEEGMEDLLPEEEEF